ncbi:MAG: NAD(+) synthase [Candidatus Faecenecus gallistercoris]|nr:NAD(+) synthase [Bacillota bacterium]MDD7102863.1 NAD(+) synthase [Bacillota bacterium]MDY4051226.1 NAD(+) synthase [Candidatus Faecenecus gallistercoris]
MNEYGYVRCAATSLKMEVANPRWNEQEMEHVIAEAVSNSVAILVLPECAMTGYTCADLFFQKTLLEETEHQIAKLKKFLEGKEIIVAVGAPIQIENKLYNMGIVLQNGHILGIVPKTYLPNYNEFYEQRWFASSADLKESEIEFLGEKVPVGRDLLFGNQNTYFALEICEDLWSVTPPSDTYALNGATILLNLSASNETIGKKEYRENLIKMHSAKQISAYVYASSGPLESTTDILFSGATLIYENGSKLAEGKRFQFDNTLTIADVDVEKLLHDRMKNTSFHTNQLEPVRKIHCSIPTTNQPIRRTYAKYPFVPNNPNKRNERANEILTIQSCALARRLKHTGSKKCILGVSGGLDSTLAYLVILRAFDILKIAPQNLIAVTMPGFGTTDRTYQNAKELIRKTGATLREVSIKDACILHYKDIGHDAGNHDVTYENAQARERTQILMDIANQESGLVIGTGDLSELALGWCTYNGDHMSMYAVNTSIPKTLVRYLVEYEMQNNETLHDVLKSILDTPISPELLPPSKDGKILQKTESKIGPYMLHDFFLYHFLRNGFSTKKIFYLAKETFKDDYEEEELRKWLTVFMKRFFSQQFKRSCLPDGVKVGSVSLSPRGDLRMPSDATSTIWIEE